MGVFSFAVTIVAMFLRHFLWRSLGLARFHCDFGMLYLLQLGRNALYSILCVRKGSRGTGRVLTGIHGSHCEALSSG